MVNNIIKNKIYNVCLYLGFLVYIYDLCYLGVGFLLCLRILYLNVENLDCFNRKKKIV